MSLDPAMTLDDEIAALSGDALLRQLLRELVVIRMLLSPPEDPGATCDHPIEGVEARGPNGSVRFVCTACRQDVTDAHLARLTGDLRG